MSNKRTDSERLILTVDALSDSLISASDSEVLEEARFAGIDPNVIGARIKALMLGTVKAYQQRSLREARHAYEEQTKRPTQTFNIPSTPLERRNLFSFILTQQPQYAELFTVQHREFTQLTDDDIKSYLEDLNELGMLRELRRGTEDGPD